jgi:murein tripeptide amidase MpaA
VQVTVTYMANARAETRHTPRTKDTTRMHPTSRRSFLRTSGLAAGAASAVTIGLAGPAAALDGLLGTRALQEAAEPMMLARVWAERSTAHLLSDFDDTHNVFDDGSVEVLLWPGDLGRLVASGLRYEITVRDFVAHDRALAAQAPARSASLALQPGETTSGDYRTLDQHNDDLAMLADRYPTLCKLIELPFKSLQGRPVFGVEIAEDVARKDGRPVFYNDGIHHAREWPAAEMPIMWAFDLLEAYSRWEARDEAPDALELHDERMHNIVRHSRNIVVPVVNPDGFHYSRSGPLGTGRQFDSSLTGLAGPVAMQYWRKNMRGYRLPNGQTVPQDEALPETGILPTTPGAIGVDPNRNYSYRWGGNGSSAAQDGQTYRGNEPFSEPEARNVQWIHQNWQAVAGITHHTSGNLVLWAWGDTSADAPDDALLARLGFACSDYNGYRPTKSIDLYVTTGTCSDYMYGAFGSISYTYEHAGSSFHPPYGSVVPQFYANNRESLMLLVELVCLDPQQRSFMYAAVDADEDVTKHLLGEFNERYSGRDYIYTAESALDLTARHNCLITGQIVDADGNGIAGTVELTKSFTNALSPNNPIGQDDFPEMIMSTIDTDADGRFRWVVYPSTQPFPESLGEQQFLTLTVTAGGSQATVDGIYLSRGDEADLGAIELGTDTLLPPPVQTD